MILLSSFVQLFVLGREFRGKYRMKKKIVSAVLCLSLFIGVGNCSVQDMYAAKKPKLNKSRITLNVGRSYKLKVNNYKGKIVWKSSKKRIATVKNNGVVTGKSKGNVNITAKLSRINRKLSCKVVINNKSVSENKSEDGMSVV